MWRRRKKKKRGGTLKWNKGKVRVWERSCEEGSKGLGSQAVIGRWGDGAQIAGFRRAESSPVTQGWATTRGFSPAREPRAGRRRVGWDSGTSSQAKLSKMSHFQSATTCAKHHFYSPRCASRSTDTMSTFWTGWVNSRGWSCLTRSGKKAALLLWDERIGLVRKHRHARYLAMASCPNRGERKIEANKEKKKKSNISVPARKFDVFSRLSEESLKSCES